MIEPRIEGADALLIVDVQRDFCPGGALAVPDGDMIIPVLNGWIAAARRSGAPVVASRDWHPKRHVSFLTEGGLWPEHCVQDTPGAAFHPDLELPDDVVKVSKGVHLDKDQYSAFEDTGLGAFLEKLGIRRIWVGGLAEEVCVRATAIDGRKEGFEVHLLEEATRPIVREQEQDALRKMRDAGVRIEGSR